MPVGPAGAQFAACYSGTTGAFSPSLDSAKEMSNDTQRTRRFLKTWAINTLAVLLAVNIVPGDKIHFLGNTYLAPILTALILGILNAFIRPILMLLALPLLIFTLGLFTLVINALLLRLVALLLPNFFYVQNFWAAFLGALIISVISVALISISSRLHALSGSR